jgi:hypothetical protein
MVFSIRGRTYEVFEPSSCQRECETKYDIPSTPRRDGVTQRSADFNSFNYSVPDLRGSVYFGLSGSGRGGEKQIRMQPILQNIMLTL